MLKTVFVLALVASCLAAPEPKPDPKPQFSRVSVTSGQTPYAYSVAHVPASYYASYPGGPFAYSGYPGYPGAAPYYNPYAFSPYGYPYSPYRYY